MTEKSYYHRMRGISENADEVEQWARESVGNGEACGCGTCKEAIDAALRTASQTLEHQCGYWMLTYAEALASVAKAYIAGFHLSGGVGPETAYLLAAEDVAMTEVKIKATIILETERIFDAVEAHFTEKH